MQALKLYGPSDLRLEEVPKPQAPSGGLVVRVESCAICGSDLRNIKAGGSSHSMTLPRVLGHETAGVIEEVGEDVEGYEPGQQVVLAIIIPCGRCPYCLQGAQNMCDNKEALSYQYDGAFAQYIQVPEVHLRAGGVIPVPPELSLAEVSLSEPFSCALNGLELSQVSLGDEVAIIGAGPLGLMQSMLAKLMGASRVILSEINPERLAMTDPFDEIDVRIDASQENAVERVIEETNGRGADVVMAAAPAGQAQVEATYMAAKRGRVNLFGGLPKDATKNTFDSNLIHYRELFVHGTSDSTLLQLRKVVDLMSAGRLKVRELISAEYPLARFDEAIELAKSGKALKVLLKPWD